MEKERGESLKSFSRQQMHDLWQRAKNDDIEGLDEEGRHIVQALQLHADEYHNIFEFADVTEEREFDPDSEENPFLHISIHTVVTRQIEQRDPIEAFQFYNAMRKKKCSHHDALHLIGAILAPLMFHTLKTLLPFDNARYVSLLKKYKSRNPEKIWSLIEDEFANDPLEEILKDYEGNCRGCGTVANLDDMGYCESCGEKFERDMLRLRKWEFSLTASYIPQDEYESLRQDTIDQFGREFEILTEEDLKEIEDL